MPAGPSAPAWEEKEEATLDGALPLLLLAAAGC